MDASPPQKKNMLRKILTPRREGQAITEFALILPILLLIIFGIIEFARVYQAYLVIVNGARFGVRYAVTGEYDPAYCVDTADGPDTQGHDGPCAGADRSEEEDTARVPSIKDVVNGVAVGILKDNSVVLAGQPGYFDVTVCSSRPGFSYDRVADRCVDEDGIDHEDAGNPEEGPTRVLVAVTFQHPMILPFINNIWPSLRLHAERTGILEQFRVARVMGLPADITYPTATPIPWTDTPPPPTATEPPPTDTPIPHTLTPTLTPSVTPTETPTSTPTPIPACEDLQINPDEPLYIASDNVVVWLYNAGGIYPAELTNVAVQWNGGWHDEVAGLPADKYFDKYEWNGGTLLNPAEHSNDCRWCIVWPSNRIFH